MFQAAAQCVNSLEVIPCITYELADSETCKDCICVLLPDIAAALGQDWSC